MATRAKSVPAVSPLMICCRRIIGGGGSGGRELDRSLVLAENGDERELAVLDRVAAHRAQRGVAVLVERPLAEHAVEVLQRRPRDPDRLAVLLAGPADRLERHLAALV